MNVDGVANTISCIGACNSKLFESRRKHRPLISCAENIHLHPTSPSQQIEPIVRHTLPATKRMRKRRERARKASRSGEQQGADIFIKIPYESDDEDSLPRSRPLIVQFLFWFCGILIVIIGIGSLTYAIIALFSKMDSIKRAITLKAKSETKLMRKFSGKRIGETAGNLAPWDTTFPP